MSFVKSIELLLLYAVLFLMLLVAMIIAGYGLAQMIFG
jgi:hypothetical protein